MKIPRAPFLISFLISISSPPCFATVAEDPDIEDEVDTISQLSAESQVANRKCKLYLDRLRKQTSNSEKSEYFVSRSAALAAIRNIPYYPGTPISTNEGLDHFLDLIDIPEGTSTERLRIAMSGLGDCHSVEFFGVMQRILDPRTLRMLTRGEISQIHDIVLNYLRRETIGGPKFLYQSENLIKLTAKGEKEKVLHFPRSTRLALVNLVWKASKISSEEDQARLAVEKGSALLNSPQSDRLYFKKLYRQLEQSEDLLDYLYLILARETSEPTSAPQINFGLSPHIP